jgi:uncharacterized protein YdhG (YjbR/CyaY superfamily)
MIMEQIDDYIATFPENIQEKLWQMHETILENAPGVSESFAYGMPAYKFNKKPLVYFAAFKNHIGFYATPSGHEKFNTALSVYKQGKGSVQFPLDQDLPLDLIAAIVRFRVEENIKKV